MVGYGFENGIKSMSTWWVVEFHNGERLQVCTETELKYEAFHKLSKMFPDRELVSICTEQEEEYLLETLGMRG